MNKTYMFVANILMSHIFFNSYIYYNVENDGREQFLGENSMGGGSIPRWKNDGRELFLGGKTTGGNYS